MAVIKNPLSGGGGGGGSTNIVNGIIEQYLLNYDSGEIDANTFVELVETGNITAGTDTAISSTGQQTALVISAVALDDTRVFIAHGYSDNYYLYGVVCTISGTTITVGTETILSSTTNNGIGISAALVDNNKVLISHTRNSSNTYYLYGIVCTISGTTITAGTDTRLSSMVSNNVTSTVKLGTNKVFIAHGNLYTVEYSSTYGLSGIVCTISGTTITAGTDTTIYNNINTGLAFSATTIDDTHVFISFCYGSLYVLYGIVCTIGGTTITAGAATALSAYGNSGAYTSTVTLSGNRVFVAHSRGNSTSSASGYLLYGIVCTIGGTTITAGTDTAIVEAAYAGVQVSVAKLDDDHVLVAHTKLANYRVAAAIVCHIRNATIRFGYDFSLRDPVSTGTAGDRISAVVLTQNQFFVAHSFVDKNSEDIHDLYCIAASISYETRIRSATDPDAIQGLTKTKCAYVTGGEVWVLDTT